MGIEAVDILDIQCEKAVTCEEYFLLQRECAEAIKEKNINKYSDLVGRQLVLTERKCYIQGFLDALKKINQKDN
ncbi:hypothetical protein [Lachnoclostridium sp.]|uniref:hypothetical protein n=1 Tax=Lachnoclostridium sp. TaxID=2028282 RepID=UPI0028A18A90|nr:hypothetical protein [Lachnoclostridium sp.]